MNVLEALAWKARELMDGMRRRTKRDPDRADFAAGFKPILEDAMSRMKQHHYEGIARIIRNARQSIPERRSAVSRGARAVLVDLTYALAEYFGSENQQFDRDRFLTLIETEEPNGLQEKK